MATLELSIIDLAGAVVCDVTALLSWTGFDLKSAIYDVTRITPETQRLHLNGYEILDQELLASQLTEDVSELTLLKLSLREARWVKLVQRNPRCLDMAHPSIQESRHIILAAVQVDGLALRFASEDLRADIDVVRVAVSQNPSALGHAALEVREALAEELGNLAEQEPEMEKEVTPVALEEKGQNNTDPVRSMFEKFELNDEARNGSISTKDLIALFCALDSNWTCERLKLLLKAAGQDGQACIQYRPFLEWLTDVSDSRKDSVQMESPPESPTCNHSRWSSKSSVACDEYVDIETDWSDDQASIDSIHSACVIGTLETLTFSAAK